LALVMFLRREISPELWALFHGHLAALEDDPALVVVAARAVSAQIPQSAGRRDMR